MGVSATIEEMVGFAGHVNTPLASAPAVSAITITGRQLARELRGKTARERAYLGAQIAAGALDLVKPLASQAAGLVRVNPKRMHRALGHTARPPSSVEMINYVGRYGLRRTEELIRQIKAVAVATGEAA